MGKLSIAITNVVRSSFWSSIFIPNNGPQLFHLVFTDEVILFWKAKSHKTELFSSHWTHVVVHKGRRSILLCLVLSILLEFLRLKLINWLQYQVSPLLWINTLAFLSSRICQKTGLLFHLRKGANSWKNKLLNESFRLALATLIVSCIPYYYMQNNWLS